MTIEDEVDVPFIDESDSEEVSTTKKPKKKKKASDLNAGFEWNEVAEKDQLTWDPFYQLQEFVSAVRLCIASVAPSSLVAAG